MQHTSYAVRQHASPIHTAPNRHLAIATPAAVPSHSHPPRQTVELRQLELHYQPIVTLDSFEIQGLEALVRLRDPRRGLLLPDAFLHQAMTAGVMASIDRWVLAEACRQTAAWRASSPRRQGLTISVNLGAERLAAPGLAGEIRSILRSTGLEPGALKLEITEHSKRSCSEITHDAIRELRELGVGFQLDDFGTGYASLSCLRAFPSEALKIDRSFVAGTAQDPVCREVVRASAGLARNLGMAAIAEGVETPAQLAAVHELGCTLAQGYFFSMPLDREEMQALLAKSFKGS